MTKPVVGKAERVSFPQANVLNLLAKVDTGAYRSSVWATKIKEKDGLLSFVLLGPSSKHYSGEMVTTTEYRRVKVENSFGHSEMRYSVFLSVEIAGKKIRSNFTLANRAKKTYSALIGRKMLKGRFLVDVSKGERVDDEEKHGDESLE